MTEEVVIGFDYGHSRIGVAIGNRLTGTSRALTAVPCPQVEHDWNAIAAYWRDYAPQALLVGIPLHMDGSRQPLTRAARRFAHELRARSALTVHEVDERLSSDAAEQELRQARAGGHKLRRNRRGDVDALAAALLVEQWLQTQ